MFGAYLNSEINAINDVFGFAAAKNYRNDVLPPAPPIIDSNQLVLPPPPQIYRATKSDDGRMESFCSRKPFVVIKGLASVVDMDFKLFESEALVQCCPGFEVTCDVFPNKESSMTLIRRETSIVEKHAKYQINFDPEKKTKFVKFGIIRFGSNTANDPFSSQVQELKKLPPFLQISSSEDMLSHIGYPIFGVNTAQVYMKVYGNRTAVHQEDGNVCSVNMNFGPADVTWWFVEKSYWGEMLRFAEKQKINFFDRLWWPNVEQLLAARIPVTTATQKPGDIIYTNIGTVHWVRSEGRTNAVAWNIAPKTEIQYNWAMDRYEFFKSLRKGNVIPMIHLIWNMAKDSKFYKNEFFKSVVCDIRLSLKRAMATKKYLNSINVQILPYERSVEEPYQECHNCKDELFNYIFMDKNGKKVFCLPCVKYINNVDCLQEFSLDELISILYQVEQNIDIVSVTERISTVDILGLNESLRH